MIEGRSIFHKNPASGVNTSFAGFGTVVAIINKKHFHLMEDI
jgi:hypothetical protein